jgi:hypothetical protein
VETVETLKTVLGSVSYFFLSLFLSLNLMYLSLFLSLSLSLSSDYNLQDKALRLSPKELTACLYYKLAVERALRGRYPDAEMHAHRTNSKDKDSAQCSPALESDISSAIRYV